MIYVIYMSHLLQAGIAAATTGAMGPCHVHLTAGCGDQRPAACGTGRSKQPSFGGFHMVLIAFCQVDHGRSKFFFLKLYL